MEFIAPRGDGEQSPSKSFRLIFPVKLFPVQELTGMVLPSANSDDEIREILIADVIVDPQVRKEFEPSSLHGLAASLKESGQLQPILVRQRGDKFHLVCGERRLTMAVRLRHRFECLETQAVAAD